MQKKHTANFSVRTLDSKEKTVNEAGKKKKDRKLTTTLAITGVVLVILVISGIYGFIRNIDLGLNFVVDTVSTVFGKQWQRDIAGNTNILLFGVGGGNHDGPDLTDSIMIMSINQDTKKVAMLSLPRDLYVAYPSELGQSGRINGIYDAGKRRFGEETGALLFKEKVSEIIGVDIQYYVKLNFQGLVEIVDELGGIEIDVPTAIVDTTYPTNNYGYQTFRISAGLQTLDGETALKYARSRHSTSDFDRSARQQLIIAAIKKKAMEGGVLTDVDKLKRLFLKFQANIQTNFDIAEILAGARIVRDMNLDQIARGGFSDDVTASGGFLYTPERSQFNGAAVLLPLGATPRSVSFYRDIQLYTDILFGNPELSSNPPRVEILNGTRMNGVATSLQYRLQRYGFPVEHVGNSQNKDVTQTKIYYYPREGKNIKGALDVLSLFVQGEVTEGDEAYALKEFDITIVIGSDYKEPAF